MGTARAHSRVHDRVDGRVQAVYLAVYAYTARVHSGVTAMYTAMNTACTWPCTRIHSPYTKPIEFATFSQTLVITPVNKAKHHIACHRKFAKYGVKRHLG